MKHLRVTTALAAGLTLALTACSGSAINGGGTETDPTGPIRIGLSTALSGAYSEFGVPMKASVDLAIKEVNDAGGVLGRPVELISYDDQLVAATAQTNVRRLLDEDNVDFVLAPAGSGPTTAIVPLVQAKGKLLMNTIAQTPEIVYPNGSDQPPHPNVFSFALPNNVEAEAMARYIADHFTRVALVAESTPYGDSGVAAITGFLAGASGVNIVASETYEQQASDVTSQLARVKRENPDVIVMIGLGNDTATIRQGLARQDLLSVPFLISNGAGTLPYQERAGELVDGTLVVNYAAYPGSQPESESAATFAKAYLTAYGNDSYYGAGEWPVPAFAGTPASSYDAVTVLLEAIEAAGTTDTPAVIAALESGQAFAAARGSYSFSATSHNGVTVSQLAVNRYVYSDGAVTFERVQGFDN